MIEKFGKLPWPFFSFIGALDYGFFSFFMEDLPKKMQKSKSALTGYGLIINFLEVISSTIGYFFWRKMYPSSEKLIRQSVSWKKMLITSVFSALTNPLHMFAINAGGAVAQQLMMTGAQIIVMILGYLFLGEKLTHKQLIGIALAIAASYLMAAK